MRRKCDFKHTSDHIIFFKNSKNRVHPEIMVFWNNGIVSLQGVFPLNPEINPELNKIYEDALRDLYGNYSNDFVRVEAFR